MSGLVERLDRVVVEWRRTTDLVEELTEQLEQTCLATTALIAAIAEERKL